MFYSGPRDRLGSPEIAFGATVHAPVGVVASRGRARASRGRMVVAVKQTAGRGWARRGLPVPPLNSPPAAPPSPPAYCNQRCYRPHHVKLNALKLYLLALRTTMRQNANVDLLSTVHTEASVARAHRALRMGTLPSWVMGEIATKMFRLTCCRLSNRSIVFD